MSEQKINSAAEGFNPATISGTLNSGSKVDKPRNGLPGLKHWAYDLRSGIMVAMISLPFSMGIAITSGAPPVCGVISAIIAGLILPFAGGSYVTISGPAAGLAPALFAGMISLATAEVGKEVAAGKSTAELLQIGYPLVLVAIAIAGVLQVILARFKIARLSAIFPAAAIEGMLAAIGMLIIAKQLPLLFGVTFEGHEFWEILAEAPRRLSEADVGVLSTGIGCTISLFILNALPYRLFKVVPPPVWVFIGGAIAAQLIFGISSQHCIQIPENPFRNGIQMPEFDRIFFAPATWLSLGYVVLVLILIDATESLATIMAVDKLDPFKRRSDPDRTLQSMGICNTASSIVGGLTIIPGIVKSTANIIGGGRTLWANFFNAVTLIVFMSFGRSLINQVPLAVLAAILIFVGWKLCGPKVWKHILKIGPEQLGVFLLTILVTVSTDLLVGISVGIFVKLLINMSLIRLANRISGNNGSPGFFQHFVRLFQNPVGSSTFQNCLYEITFDRPLHCFNLLHVIREMKSVHSDAKTLRLHFAPLSNVIDHTSVETIFHYVKEYELRGVEVELVGWDRFLPLSEHEGAVRFGPIENLSERQSRRLEETGAL